MKSDIKKIVLSISHKKTRNLIQNHVTDIEYRDSHVLIYVDNAAPLRELKGGVHEENLQKALDQVFGEDVTYELKLLKKNSIHRRAQHAVRRLFRK